MSHIATITLNPALDIAVAAPQVLPTIKIRCGPPTVQAGGGGINVARVAARFGATTSPIVLAGGASGGRILSLMHEEGLSPIEIAISGETRESLTVTEGSSHEQFRFVLPGPTITADEAAATLAAVRAMDPCPSVVVVSGSHPAGLEASFFADLVDTVRGEGARLIVDGPAPVLQATHGAYLIKPNERELGDLCGRSVHSQEAAVAAARDVIGMGIAHNVLVSMGEAGAFLVTEASAWHYKVPPVELVSAVGAGDSMVGALATALASGVAIEDAVTRGAAAGTAAILTPGTDLCTPEDTERFLPMVTRAEVERVI
ncbi:MAG: 1-phosphofructokinase family hexose kinase [Pseudomonadota bacterium]